VALDLGVVLLVAWMPIYLLLMQKRVYAQAWWLTVLKYVVIGNIYFVMLAFATMMLFLGRLTSA